jgi:hypothetical protein
MATHLRRRRPSRRRAPIDERLSTVSQAPTRIVRHHRPVRLAAGGRVDRQVRRCGVVDRVRQRHLQSWADAEQPERVRSSAARPESLLDPLAHRFEVDPQLRERLRVDPRCRGSVHHPAGKRWLNRVWADPKLREQPRGGALASRTSTLTGFAIAPISFATWLRSSSSFSPEPSAPPFSVT